MCPSKIRAHIKESVLKNAQLKKDPNYFLKPDFSAEYFSTDPGEIIG